MDSSKYRGSHRLAPLLESLKRITEKEVKNLSLLLIAILTKNNISCVMVDARLTPGDQISVESSIAISWLGWCLLEIAFSS